MVTQSELREHLGRRPFESFRVILTNGDAIDITQIAQAVAMPRELVLATPQDVFQRVRLELIDRLVGTAQ